MCDYTGSERKNFPPGIGGWTEGEQKYLTHYRVVYLREPGSQGGRRRPLVKQTSISNSTYSKYTRNDTTTDTLFENLNLNNLTLHIRKINLYLLNFFGELELNMSYMAPRTNGTKVVLT